MDIILFECFVIVCFIIRTFNQSSPEWLHANLKKQSDFKGIMGIIGGTVLIIGFHKFLFGDSSTLITNTLVMLVIALFFLNWSKIREGFTDILLIIAMPLFLDCLSIIYTLISLNIQPEFMTVNRILFMQLYNAFLLGLGMLYLREKNINPFPLFLMRTISVRSVLLGLFGLLVLLLNAVLFISISGAAAIEIRSVNASLLFPWLVQLFNLAFNEELVFRLLLFAMFYRLFNDDDIGALIAISLSSVLWAFQHYFIDYNSLKFVMVLTNGLFLGYLMKKCGVEICIIVHFLFNIIAFTILGKINM